MNILMVDIHCQHPSSNGNILIAEHPKTVFFLKKTGCKLYIHNYKNMEERKLNKAANFTSTIIRKRMQTSHSVNISKTDIFQKGVVVICEITTVC
jgi:hypothetical protein